MPIKLTQRALERIHAFDPLRCSREGDIPSRSDSRLIRIIASAREELKDDILRIPAESEITSVGNLRHELDLVERYIDACQSFMRPSPIRSVPNEILGQILEYVCTCPIEIDFRLSNTLHSAKAVLRLGWVCSRWRAVSISLFTAVTLLSANALEDISKWKRMKSLTYQILERSHPHHISLTLKFQGSQPVAQDVLLPKFDKLLSPYLPRLRVLVFPYHNLLLQPPGTFSALVSLTLNNSNLKAFGATQLDISNCAPNIRFLTLIGDLDGLQVQWDKLLSLSLRFCSMKYVMHILRRCPQIRTLRLQRVIQPSFSLATPPVLLQYLDTLHVHLLHAGGFIFSALTTPSLAGITCLPRQFDLTTASTSVLELIHRSKSTITTLKIVSDKSGTLLEPLVAGMVQLQALESLVWTDTGRNDLSPVLRALHWPNFPRLKQLDLCSTGPIRSDLFLSMIRSRWSGDISPERCFQSVLLQASQVSEFVWKPLSMLQREGLRIHIDDSQGCMRSRFEARKNL